ncbi:MAG: hypothetical protein RIS34_2503 [Pseudomonadota bacterium]|jgi:uncharacterized protein YndB with AHSA1/START domain
MNIDGACHCGKVSFSAQIDPEKVMICNCTDCQTLSGAPFRTIVPAPIESFKLTGVTRSYVKVAESGSKRAQVFCPECGTPLYSTALENATQVMLRLGCVSQRSQLKPVFQLWQRSAAPWLSEIGSIPGVQTQLPPPPAIPVTTFNTSREIPATVEQVFAAISDSQRLARWWGPAGFTNTVSVCEFKNGGRWSFVMHGPDGNNYPNECVFADIESPRKVVVQHVVEPEFRLTITLASVAGTGKGTGTLVSWSQAFESPEVASHIEHIVVPANEQNLDRLSVEVLSG